MLEPYGKYVYTGTEVPSLGEVRGKIVLLRDYSARSPLGIAWEDIALQDEYNMNHIGGI